MNHIFQCLILPLLLSPAVAGEPLAFRQASVQGQMTSVAPGEHSATVVFFLGAECPMAKLYGPRMSRLAEEFDSGGVQVIGINSNRQDSIADIEQYIRRQGITFPVIRDENNVIANRYGAVRTPEVYLLDGKLDVRYQGRVDDQYEPGVSRKQPERQDLRIAIEELLAGKPVSVPKTEALGCLIGKVSSSSHEPFVENDITFYEHVVPVLQRHCTECHREGDIGPFAVQEYDEVVGWASTMLETIDDGRMPPWSADPDIGEFANARHMSNGDKQTFRDWIAGGLKQGDAAKRPPPLEYADGWQLPREPDLVLPMRDRPFQVPAEGTVEYQYFVVDPQFEEDRWVRGAQIIPGARTVVHHAIAFLRPPDGVAMRGIGWLTAYVPGQRLVPLPPGHARKVPAGSRIVFQMHYTTSGQEQDDISKVGLLFADAEDVTHEVITLIGVETEFEIPPHAANHEVSADVGWLPEGGRLLGVAPHMHYRGTSFELYANRKNKSETLLSVPRYDFNWQHSYEFAEPLPLDDIDRLHFTATFDNSEGNPFNPDATEWVTWGDQTWEEMAVAFFEVAEPRKRDQSESLDVAADTTPVVDSARQKKIDSYIERVFAQLDANEDGQITRAETPIVVRRFNFREFDHDGDDIATREEVRKLAESLF